MRVPLNWLADYVDLPADTDPHALAAEFAGVGLEEEDFFGPEVTGPLVVGRVLDLVKEEHSNGKTISWCRVDVGPQHNEALDDPKDPAARPRGAQPRHHLRRAQLRARRPHRRLPAREPSCPEISPSPPARPTATPPTG
jgi:hypothetical protein